MTSAETHPPARPLRPLDREEQMKRLSPRESEILRWSATGREVADIAASLYLSVDTVKGHRQRICRKFNVQNILAAVSYAYQHSILPAPLVRMCPHCGWKPGTAV